MITHKKAHYIDCIIVKDVATIKSKHSFNPIQAKLHAEINNKAIHSKFINYQLNPDAKDFGSIFGSGPQINKTANSCFINAILNTFQSAFNKKKSDGRRMFKELTFESLMDMFQIDHKTDNIGLSIHKSLQFFEKFRLGLDVIDTFETIVFQYRPEKLNEQINPQVLRILVHNNHCYQLNENITSFAQIKEKLTVEDDEFHEKMIVSDKYHLIFPISSFQKHKFS